MGTQTEREREREREGERGGEREGQERRKEAKTRDRWCKEEEKSFYWSIYVSVEYTCVGTEAFTGLYRVCVSVCVCVCVCVHIRARCPHLTAHL